MLVLEECKREVSSLSGHQTLKHKILSLGPGTQISILEVLSVGRQLSDAADAPRKNSG